MLAYLHLFRFPNLLIIALTQILVRYCIIMPAYIAEYRGTGTFPEHLSGIEFWLLVFSTVIIAAGGYIINDVFDVFTDEINKPGKNIIGKKLSEKTARIISYLFFFIGSVLGFLLAVKKHVAVMGLLFPFSAFSLYMYSSYYKKHLLTGNFLIALLSALTVFIVAVFEPYYFVRISIWIRGSEEMSWIPGWQIILFYMVIAFLISLIREIIKDAEDIEGDMRTQGKTFPIRFGIKNTKQLVSILLLINTIFITFFLYKYFSKNLLISFWYLMVLFLIPFLALFYMVVTAHEKKDFYYASFFSKMAMLFGILTMVPFYFYFLR